MPFIKPDEQLPKISAEIRYTETGRLKGRWEIVKPGETLPEARDLLSEAALPPEERGTQRRYTLLNRFNINLPPGGKYILPGLENWRIDKTIQGMYLLLFRVEASDASDSASNIGKKWQMPNFTALTSKTRTAKKFSRLSLCLQPKTVNCHPLSANSLRQNN